MIYTLTLSTRSNPHAFSIGFEDEAEAIAAIQQAIERKYFQVLDFLCTLGPGCVMRLVAENVDEVQEIVYTNVSHYLVCSLHGKQITLEFASEGAADNAIADMLRTGAFEQSFKGGADRVYIFVEPGTCFLKLPAAEYKKLSVVAQAEEKRIILGN